MSTTKEVVGITGYKSKRSTTVFVMENNDGSRWYVAEGGTMVNKTWDPIEDGVDIEALKDADVFTWDNPINDMDEFIKAIEA